MPNPSRKDIWQGVATLLTKNPCVRKGNSTVHIIISLFPVSDLSKLFLFNKILIQSDFEWDMNGIHALSVLHLAKDWQDFCALKLRTVEITRPSPNVKSQGRMTLKHYNIPKSCSLAELQKTYFSDLFWNDIL